MTNPHHLPPNNWTFLDKDGSPTTWFTEYGLRWVLTVEFDEKKHGWHCKAQPMGAPMSDFVAGARDEPADAMARCYQMADERDQQNEGES